MINLQSQQIHSPQLFRIGSIIVPLPAQDDRPDASGRPGSLGNFEYIDRLGEIHCPCLIFSESEDLCTPAVARAMHNGIPGSRWELLEGARHMCFVDRHEDYCRILESWLEEQDGRY